MSARSILLAAFALVVTSTACQPAVQEAGPLSDEDRAAIGNLRESYRQATLAGDWAAVAALYAPDGVRMPPNQAIEEGRAAIQASLAAEGASVTDWTITSVELDGRGGLAYDRGTYSITLRVEGMPEPIMDTGKYLVTLVKHADGSWLLTSAIFNSDLPLPEPESAMGGRDSQR